MGDLKLSVIIPTHNRPEKLAETLAGLKQQDLQATAYEIIVVDDNSTPPVVFPENAGGPKLTLVRLDGTERSVGRNTGAGIANGSLLVFVDDDMTVEKDFLSCHLRAHEQWPGALVVGSVRLPHEAVQRPFGRFRQKLEDQSLPETRGPVAMPNFCTAANMSISREAFRVIGGFDRTIISSEDQDFALRHTGRGGQIIFLPEAKAIHRDSSLDIRSYCQRVEWGSRNMLPFCHRYPERSDNIERLSVNGKLCLGREPFSLSLRKLIKSALSVSLMRAIVFGIASVLERFAPHGSLLDRVYRLLVGIHLLRGFRQGLIQYDSAPEATKFLTGADGLDGHAKASN